MGTAGTGASPEAAAVRGEAMLALAVVLWLFGVAVVIWLFTQ